jgi:hypothetical protein
VQEAHPVIMRAQAMREVLRDSAGMFHRFAPIREAAPYNGHAHILGRGQRLVYCCREDPLVSPDSRMWNSAFFARTRCSGWWPLRLPHSWDCWRLPSGTGYCEGNCGRCRQQRDGCHTDVKPFRAPSLLPTIQLPLVHGAAAPFIGAIGDDFWRSSME